MRFPARLLRTSYRPRPNALHTGIPTGQPNSTVLMSSPIRLRSSGKGRLLSQSRTGSLPASVRKKIAGTRLPSFPDPPSCDSSVNRLCSWRQRNIVPHTVHFRWEIVEQSQVRNRDGVHEFWPRDAHDDEPYEAREQSRRGDQSASKKKASFTVTGPSSLRTSSPARSHGTAFCCSCSLKTLMRCDARTLAIRSRRLYRRRMPSSPTWLRKYWSAVTRFPSSPHAQRSSPGQEWLPFSYSSKQFSPTTANRARRETPTTHPMKPWPATTSSSSGSSSAGSSVSVS